MAVHLTANPPRLRQFVYQERFAVNRDNAQIHNPPHSQEQSPPNKAKYVPQ